MPMGLRFLSIVTFSQFGKRQRLVKFMSVGILGGEHLMADIFNLARNHVSVFLIE